MEAASQGRPQSAGPASHGASHVICQRCYGAKHYGRLAPVEADEETFREYVRAIRRQRALVVNVVDLMDWPGSVLPDLKGLLRLDRPGVDVVVAVNKRDLLPRSADLARVRDWARAGLREAGLGREAVADVVLVSGRTGAGCEELLASLKRHRKGRDVFVVGAANAGKSTLVNRLLHSLWVAPFASTPPGRRAMRGGGAVLDEADLPPGLRAGDVIAGGEAGLRRVLDAARASEAAAADAGLPAPRFAVADAQGRAPGAASHPLAPVLAAQGGDAADAAERARMAALDAASRTVSAAGSGSDAAATEARAAAQGASNDSPDDILAGAAALAAGVVALPPQLRPAADAASSTPGRGAGLEAAASALDGARSDAWLSGIPLTTSPMPGTTLGVIGAPLGPSHGGGFLFDTPGLSGDESRAWQALVERVVSDSGSLPDLMSWMDSPSAAAKGWDGVPDAVARPPQPGKLDPISAAPPRRVLAARTPLKTARSMMPARPLLPRHVRLRPGSSVVLGGLCRLDYSHLAEGGPHMLATVFSGLPGRSVAGPRVEALLAAHAWLGGELWPSAGALAPVEGEAWTYDAAAEAVRWPHVWPGDADLGGRSLGSPRPRDRPGIAPRPSRGASSAIGFRLVDWADDVTDDWDAPPRGGNPGRTRHRRMHRSRRALVDVVFGGVAWIALTPIEVEGMFGWERAVKGARFRASAAHGVSVTLRPPLLPFEASGTRPRDWK